MKGKYIARFTVIIFSLLILLGCGGSKKQTQGKAGRKPVKKAQSRPADNPWINLKRTNIAIPPDIGGEAKLTKNIYFIMDGSGSMGERTSRECGGDQKFKNKITGARWAINRFLEKVPNDVNIGLYIFDNKTRGEVVPLGISNRDQFFQAIGNMQTGRDTPLAAAIKYGTDRLVGQYKKQLGYGEFRLVVVTDGIAEKIPQAAMYAARYGIPIYAIGLCVGQRHPLRYYSLSYRAADNFDDLQKGLEETLAELPNFDVTQFNSEGGQ